MAPDGPSRGAALARWVEALRHAHKRRSRAQAVLDGVRWACIAYIGVVLAMLVVGGSLDARRRLLGALVAAAVGSAVGHWTHRRQARAPSSLVAELDRALEADQLLTTAWAWRVGLISSPLGPAMARRADRLVEDRPPSVGRLVAPIVGKGRTLVAVAAAILLTLPGPDVGLDRLLRRLEPPPSPGFSQEPSEPAMSPEQSALLQRLASLLEQRAATTADPAAARAAEELRQAASLASPPPGEGQPGHLGSWGSVGEMTASGAGPVQTPLQGTPTSPLGLATLWDRLSLLARLARLGLISSDAADRAAEVLAMLAARGEGAEATVEPSGTPSSRGADATPPPSSESRATPTPTSPPSSYDGPSGIGGDAGTSASAAGPAPSSSAPASDGAAASGGQGETVGTTPAPPAGSPSAGPSEGAAPAGSRPSPEMAGSSGAPGSGPGSAPDMPAAGPVPVDGGRIALPSSPQLGPGEAHALPGVPARPVPQPGQGDVAGPLDLEAGPSRDAPLPEPESVPVEYREAVRRYFEMRAGGGMDG